MEFTKKEKRYGAVALLILGLMLLAMGWDLVGGIFTFIGALFTKKTVSSHKNAPKVSVGGPEGNLDLTDPANLRDSIRDKTESFMDKLK